MLPLAPSLRPSLERDFVPAALWNRAYGSLVARDPGSRPFALVLRSPGGAVSRRDSRVLGAGHPQAALTLIFAERLLKFLLWQRGGCHVSVGGADEVARHLATVYASTGARAFDHAFPATVYASTGARAFDHAFMGEHTYQAGFRIEACPLAELPAEAVAVLPVGRHLDGCRIGFDLGGSDRKAAALIDGKVVFSEEIAWEPYFQQDPAYHLEGIHDSLVRAARHLPRVDAIGGSAAGVYVNNEVRVASLFRGVPRPRRLTRTCAGYSSPFKTAGEACPSRSPTTARLLRSPAR